eukprot:UN09103
MREVIIQIPSKQIMKYKCSCVSLAHFCSQTASLTKSYQRCNEITKFDIFSIS